MRKSSAALLILKKSLPRAKRLNTVPASFSAEISLSKSSLERSQIFLKGPLSASQSKCYTVPGRADVSGQDSSLANRLLDRVDPKIGRGPTGREFAGKCCLPGSGQAAKYDQHHPLFLPGRRPSMRTAEVAQALSRRFRRYVYSSPRRADLVSRKTRDNRVLRR